MTPTRACRCRAACTAAGRDVLSEDVCQRSLEAPCGRVRPRQTSRNVATPRRGRVPVAAPGGPGARHLSSAPAAGSSAPAAGAAMRAAEKGVRPWPRRAARPQRRNSNLGLHAKATGADPPTGQNTVAPITRAFLEVLEAHCGASTTAGTAAASPPTRRLPPRRTATGTPSPRL